MVRDKILPPSQPTQNQTKIAQAPSVSSLLQGMQFNFEGEGQLQRSANFGPDYINGYMVALNDVMKNLKSINCLQSN